MSGNHNNQIILEGPCEANIVSLLCYRTLFVSSHEYRDFVLLLALSYEDVLLRKELEFGLLAMHCDTLLTEVYL